MGLLPFKQLTLPSLLIAVFLCPPFVVLSQLYVPVADAASPTSLDPVKTNIDLRLTV